MDDEANDDDIPEWVVLLLLLLVIFATGIGVTWFLVEFTNP